MTTPRLHWAGATVPFLVLLAGCVSNSSGRTLAELRNVQPNMAEVRIADGLDKAMAGYQRYLEETPANRLTPEAMRRLADLQIEKEYGVLGGDRDLATPQRAAMPGSEGAFTGVDPRVAASNIADLSESDVDFVERASGHQLAGMQAERIEIAGETADAPRAPRQAIETYQRILAEYPHYERSDQVLYQMARAYDELGEPSEAMQVMEQLIAARPDSQFMDEVYFRRGEYFFVRKKYLDAEDAYKAITMLGPDSSFYELALYKLGWTLYKQELYEEALHQYVALLDYKLSIGYDFDQATGPQGDLSAATPHQDDERRVADTFRIISLAFSNLGGPDVLNRYFSEHGGRSFENRIYSNLGEFYLTKLRYNDAAEVYESFVELNPLHKVAPHFSMRVVEIYADGGFAKLVVESKKTFATIYGLNAPYWNHFDVERAPEVVSYLKTNLKDLASHYHSQYQQAALVDEQPDNYNEALHWYHAFLDSFPQADESPSINYQLADLLLEHRDFAAAAGQYERTSYGYATHARASAAGYAAIFAHREHLKVVDEAERPKALLATVESSLRFADTYPDHESAAAVLGAAAEDLYAMQAYPRAIAAGRTLVNSYPGAEVTLRRAAWSVIAHASFDLVFYADAEMAYAEVLALTAQDDESRQALFDNLAASIYKQGEQAAAAEDHRSAAEHYLRIKAAAPTSQIRAAAEYDAAVALIKLEDWPAAAGVLQDFRAAHTGHELGQQVTKQLAFVYREAGELAHSAEEYERVADESEDPQVQSEALLVAGGLYEDAAIHDRALAVYQRYVDTFPTPLDLAVETRFKIAGLLNAAGQLEPYFAELRRIVAIDADAGRERTDRTRFLAANSALTLTELQFEHFATLELSQPFDRSLAEKQRRMDDAMSAFDRLIDYEVAPVTAAATFYMAEIYSQFGRALLDSERPADLSSVELADYEIAIEGEAFPFEEKAIDIHEKNLELMLAGTFNEWVQKSLDQLAVLMPGRYAKNEISGGFMGSIDSYAYVAPTADDIEPKETVHAEDDGTTEEKPEIEVGDQIDDSNGAGDVSAAY